MTEPPTDPNAAPDNPRADIHASSINKRPAEQSLLQSKTAVLAILFLGTGALGIPLLWTNHRFSTKERLFWASVAMIYSLSLLLFLGWFIYWLKAQVMG